MIVRSLPEGSAGQGDFIAPSNGRLIQLPVKDVPVLRLDRGSWVIRAWQAGVIGEARIMLDGAIREVNVEAIQGVTEGWRLLRIVDYTQECSDAGTAFFPGMGTLASMEIAAANAGRMASRLAEDHTRSPPAEGHLTMYPCLAVAAHADGEVVVPAWMPDRVVVIPAGKLALYEGRVDWDAGTITVQRPPWASLVVFEPDSLATPEQLAVLNEPGWFVALREYSDPQDLVTVGGSDAKEKAVDGLATISSAAPGSYVAYYVRAGTVQERDPATGRLTMRTTLQWFDTVKFEVGPGTTRVALPTSRSP
jgi:hypothetical protein